MDRKYPNNKKVDEHPSPMLQLKNISFHYQENNPILKNINLEIHQGEMISIVGANGTGKVYIWKTVMWF